MSAPVSAVGTTARVLCGTLYKCANREPVFAGATSGRSTFSALLRTQPVCVEPRVWEDELSVEHTDSSWPSKPFLADRFRVDVVLLTLTNATVDGVGEAAAANNWRFFSSTPSGECKSVTGLRNPSNRVALALESGTLVMSSKSSAWPVRPRTCVVRILTEARVSMLAEAHLKSPR